MNLSQFSSFLLLALSYLVSYGEYECWMWVSHWCLLFQSPVWSVMFVISRTGTQRSAPRLSRPVSFTRTDVWPPSPGPPHHTGRRGLRNSIMWARGAPPSRPATRRSRGAWTCVTTSGTRTGSVRSVARAADVTTMSRWLNNLIIDKNIQQQKIKISYLSPAPLYQIKFIFIFLFQLGSSSVSSSVVVLASALLSVIILAR